MLRIPDCENASVTGCATAPDALARMHAHRQVRCGREALSRGCSARERGGQAPRRACSIPQTPSSLQTRRGSACAGLRREWRCQSRCVFSQKIFVRAPVAGSARQHEQCMHTCADFTTGHAAVGGTHQLSSREKAAPLPAQTHNWIGNTGRSTRHADTIPPGTSRSLCK